MDATMFDFNSVQMVDNGFGFNLPTIDPLNAPIYPMPFNDVDMMDDIYTFHPQPIDMSLPGAGIAPVTDIFGFTRICDPLSVDIISGLPSDAFSQTSAQVMHEQNQAKLEESSNLEHERDIAVEKYHDAIRSKDYDEALKWESIANDRLSSLYTLWNTPKYYSGPVRASRL